MTTFSLSPSGWLKKSLFFLLFFVLESMVFAILPLSARLPTNTLLYIHAGLAAALLVVALILRRCKNAEPYWEVGYAFFLSALAILLSTLFAGRLLELVGLTPTNPQGIAVAKLAETLLRVIPILALTMLAGADLRSMYLNRGRIGLGLAIGIAGFVGFAGLAFMPLAGHGGDVSKLLSLSPWILIFVLANGFGEELLFRGIFLRRYEPFLGKGLANLLTAGVFTLLHVPVTYTPDIVQFLLVLFPLALIWGYLMQKTDSLWGSALFHAGADCMIVFGVFAK